VKVYQVLLIYQYLSLSGYQVLLPHSQEAYEVLEFLEMLLTHDPTQPNLWVDPIHGQLSETHFDYAYKKYHRYYWWQYQQAAILTSLPVSAWSIDSPPALIHSNVLPWSSDRPPVNATCWTLHWSLQQHTKPSADFYAPRRCSVIQSNIDNLPIN